MRKNLAPCLFILLFFYSGCIPETQPAYYLSPLDINVHSYHAIPLRSDSVKSAMYTNFTFTAGTANEGGSDVLYSFRGGIHRSNNFGLFQAYYGAGLALGSYHVGDYYRINYSGGGFSIPPFSDTVSHIPTSNNFFGAYGFNGGINIAIPSPGRSLGEFRIGVETAIQNEFGNYLAFRKSLPDSAVDIVATNHWTKTIGGYLEFLARRRRNGTVFGYKISAGGSFISPDTYKGDKSINGPFYFSNTFHLTRGKVTGFCQFNFGTYEATFQTGINYKLGGRRKD